MTELANFYPRKAVKLHVLYINSMNINRYSIKYDQKSLCALYIFREMVLIQKIAKNKHIKTNFIPGLQS